jgi:acyl-CoA dehydrogenase
MQDQNPPAAVDEAAEFRAAVRAFAEAELAPFADAMDAPEPMPAAAYAKLAQNGYLGVTLPVAYGGAELTLRQYCLVLEEFSRIHSGFALAVTMSSGPIQKSVLAAANPALRDDILPAVCRGEIKMAFALTEPEAGSDAAAIRTRADKVEGGWKLNGRKHYITLGDEAEWIQVIAVTDAEKRARGGMTAFLVRRADPGFSVGRIDVSFGNDRLAELNFDDSCWPMIASSARWAVASASPWAAWTKAAWGLRPTVSARRPRPST